MVCNQCRKGGMDEKKFGEKEEAVGKLSGSCH